VLASVGELPKPGTPAVVRDSDAVTPAMDAEVELISASQPAHPISGAVKSEPGPPVTLGSAATRTNPHNDRDGYLTEKPAV
jgi:hypothetical protein